MKQKASHNSIHIRTANEADCERVFEWISHPDVRAAAFSNEEINWATHQKWFSRIIESSKEFYLIGELDGEPLGQVRLDPKPQEAAAKISICLAPERRGQGLGSKLLEKCCNKFFKENKIKEIQAFVRQNNLASIRVFEKAGFSEKSECEVKGVPAFQLTLRSPYSK